MGGMGKHTEGIHYLSVPEGWRAEKFLGFWVAKNVTEKSQMPVKVRKKKKGEWGVSKLYRVRKRVYNEVDVL